MKRPVTMYAESTPNPATMKFVADVMLVTDGNTAEYVNQQEAKGSSSRAEAVFNFPFVSGVFIASNFIAITKYNRSHFYAKAVYDLSLEF